MVEKESDAGILKKKKGFNLTNETELIPDTVN